MFRARGTRPAIGSLLALVLSLGAFGGSRASAVEDQNGCRTFQTMNEPGSTDLRSNGSTRFQNSSNGPGVLAWDVHAQILPPNDSSGDLDLLRGFLVVDIDFDNGGGRTFSSTCVSRVHTSVGFLNEAIYGGAVCVTAAPTTAVRPRGNAELCSPARGMLHLERVARRRANLVYTELSSGFSITRNNALAPGSKTGNGDRDAPAAG